MTTFPNFSKLPYELRLQIWELSIRPSRPDLVGIHYFSITNYARIKEDKNLCFSVLYRPSPEDSVDQYICENAIWTVPGIGDNNAKNCSAYMWDTGVWTACRESSKVAMKAFKMKDRDDWMRKVSSIKSSLFLDKGLGERDRCLPLLKSAIPRRAGSRTTDDPFNLMARPFQDICCIDIKALLAMEGQRRTMFDFSDLLFQYLFPFHDMFRFYTPTALIFEFDPSWNIDFPSAWFTLFGEKSPRGLIGHVLNQIIEENEDEAPYIWLLDRCQRRKEDLDSSKPPKQVFYDYDHEYVAIGLDYNSEDNCETAARFIKMLADVCDDEDEIFLCQSDRELGRQYATTDYIGVLGYR